MRMPIAAKLNLIEHHALLKMNKLDTLSPGDLIVISIWSYGSQDEMLMKLSLSTYEATEFNVVYLGKSRLTTRFYYIDGEPVELYDNNIISVRLISHIS